MDFNLFSCPSHIDFDDLASSQQLLVEASADIPSRSPRLDILIEQYPTPSPSLSSSPNRSLEPEDVVSVSTSFNPASFPDPPDLVFTTADGVLFYVHTHIIFKVSENAFRPLLSSWRRHDSAFQNGPFVVQIPETSEVLNVILHMLYRTSPAQNSPSLQTLMSAVNHMPTYDIVPKDHIVASTPLHSLLLSQAPLYPIEIYMLAAAHDLYDLAVPTSSHLLSFQLSSITDDMARRMGPVYLKRLFDLHLSRFSALKNILLIPPHPHAPTRDCTFSDQTNLTRAWALVAAYLAWEGKADFSTNSLQSALSPLTKHLTCRLCIESLQHRVRDIIVQWASVKRTI